MAEWIAPELNPNAVSSPSRVRYGFYALAGVAAAIVIALIVFDASALGMSEPSGVQRASGWAW